MDAVFITLGGVQLYHVIGREASEDTSVSILELVNKATPSVKEEIWNRKPEVITIICRADDTDKWAIEQKANALASIVLNEDGSTTTVWIARIRSHYEYTKTTKAVPTVFGITPWLMQIELIVVG